MMQLRHACWLVPFAALAGIISACASTQTGVRTRNCQIAAPDSVYLATGPVYRDCAVTVRAVRISVGSHPDFREPEPRDGCCSTDVELVVDTLGYPEANSASVVRTNSRALTDALLPTVGTWRYQPATLDGVPVRQIVIQHEVVQTRTVVVRSGSMPPSGPPVGAPPPTC